MDMAVKSDISLSPLKKTQDLLKKQGLDGLLLRSTDKYFNEYVPHSHSIRAYITGFDGSVGDAIILKDKAFLLVDGRYTLQAKSQAKGFEVIVCEINEGIEKSVINNLPKIFSKGAQLAYDPNTIDLSFFDQMHSVATKIGLELVPQTAEFFLTLMPQLAKPIKERINIWPVNESITGQSVTEKISVIGKDLDRLGVDGILVTKLDDIAWLANLRGDGFAFQRTFPSLAYVSKENIILGLSEHCQSDNLKHPHIELVNENKAIECIKGCSDASNITVGIDTHECSKAHEQALRSLSYGIEQITNPLSGLKAIKNEKELLHMRSAFKKADQVVYKTQNFVVDCFEKNEPCTEGTVDDQVQAEFKNSSAQELSFRPICGSGKNGAIIHYGTPNREEAIESGALFLLDTGGYYQGGYATDLTRTFLAAKKGHPAKDWQKTMFTLVLKASINGLSARIKRGSLGMQLDAIVRAPLWQAGLDFAHGTGHGVGINVHESPPRISGASMTELLPGQVFSIEPGLYFENVGGVRIENLATVVADPDNDNFLRVLPLTFCPLDERLIDERMLDSHEKTFLEYFRSMWEKDCDWPELPPLKTINF